MDRHVIGSRVEVGLVTTPEAYLGLREFLKFPVWEVVGSIILICTGLALALCVLSLEGL